MIKKTLIFVFLLLLTAQPLTASDFPTILIDQGHKQQFLFDRHGPLDLSILAGFLRGHNAELKNSTGQLSAESLRDIDGVIISGAFQPLTDDEVKAVVNFIENGGKAALMTHIPTPYQGLCDQLGVSISNGIVLEQHNILDGNGQDFMVKDLSPHPLTIGLENFAVYGAWALLARKDYITDVARTSPEAWVDLNRNKAMDKADAKQSFSMIVAGKKGFGEFVVFGDDAIFQNRFLKDGNRTLAANLAAWLCQGDRHHLADNN